MNDYKAHLFSIIIHFMLVNSKPVLVIIFEGYGNYLFSIRRKPLW